MSATSVTAAAAGSTNVSKVYQHWADGDGKVSTSAEWNNNILSDNKSDYFEGEVIPNVFWYGASNKAPLVTGQSYSFNVTYNLYQSNTNAGGYAYMTTYNIDRQPTALTGTMPTRDTVDPARNGGGMRGDFYTVNADVTDVSAVRLAGKGSVDGVVTITFTYTGPTTTNGGAEIDFGLMVAMPGMVPNQGKGLTDGAAAWTGGSLQTTVDIGGSGATSIQLAPSAIIVGEISGMKFNDVDGNGVRDPDGADNRLGTADDEGGLPGWTIFLDLDADGQLDGGEASVVTDALGRYTLPVTPDANPATPDNDPFLVREVAQASWTQTSPNPAPITIDARHPTASGVDFGNQRDLPSLRIVKDATVPGGTADVAGELISYTIDVINTGNRTLTGVLVTDPFVSDLQLIPDGATADGELDVGETWHYRATHAVTQAEIDAGQPILNISTADTGQTPPSSDDASVPVEQRPSLRIVKDATVPGGTADAAGELISYTIDVINTGNRTLTGVLVTDPFVSDLQLIPDGATSDGELDVGETWHYRATHAVTQAEIDAGQPILNISTADTDQTPPSSDDASVPVEQRPVLALIKAVAGIDGGNGDALANAVGDVIHYRISVYNNGNETLTGVSVVDPFTGMRYEDLTLTPGTHRDFDTQYVLTQQDLDNNGGGDGSIENTATADSDQTAAVSDFKVVPLQTRPSLSINKVLVGVDGGNGNAVADAAGDVLNYSVEVRNVGTVTLTNLRVTDALTGLDENGRSLDPGQSVTYTTSYVLTQADLDGKGGGDGYLDNTAVATSDQTGPLDDTESAPLLYNAALGLNKSLLDVTEGNGNGIADAPGDRLNFRVVVSNVGTITLTDVAVNDPLTGLSTTVPILAPGETDTFLTSYVLTQADLDTLTGGELVNVSNADSLQTDPVIDGENVQLFRFPILALDKSYIGVDGGNGNAAVDTAGDVLHFRFVLVNPGNLTQTDVQLADPLTLFSVSGLTLNPGETRTFFADYVLTQADLDDNGGGDGQIDDTATALSAQSGPASDSEAVPLNRIVGLSFDEQFIDVTGGNGNGLADAAGDVLNYRFTVSNQGNVTLTNVRVTDVQTGLDTVVPALAPGQVQTLLASYVLQQSDIDSNGGGDGRLENFSQAQADQNGGASDTESVTLIYDPQVDLTKSVSVDGGLTWSDANVPDGPVSNGVAPQFKFTVRNIGNVTLPGVLVTDSVYDLNGADPGGAHLFGALTPGQTLEWVFTDTVFALGVQSDVATAEVVGMPTVKDVDNVYYIGV